MSDTKTKNVIELSTNCSCVFLDEDDNWKESEYCSGICWEDSIDALAWEIEEWKEANGFTDRTLIRVQAEAVGWMRRSGYKDVYPEDVSMCLNLDSDFTIRFTFSEDYKTLTAQRFSHDEPTGTGTITFTESPLSKCDYCGDVDSCMKLGEDNLCEFCHERESVG